MHGLGMMVTASDLSIRFLHRAILAKISRTRPLVLGGVLLGLAACSTQKADPEEITIIYASEPAAYCYRSLANVDCYEQPVPEKERTLLTVSP
ncbi:hypothetical protein O4H49_02515 [Kiloniella laminariae]|uniref:Lipoprotein n=1 Tax=Kiloniella laminariae TaxID=454162 RepID=A0ABT4LEW0_9PROT|nr:hypothetical protein [Kiloniella laminariae]MCZ4279634.1 hypothetical protein [Kiloniella laminariae]